MTTEDAGGIGRIGPALRAFCLGRFDAHVFKDIERVGGDDESARKIASAYYLLFAASVWLLAAVLFAVSARGDWTGAILSLYSSLGCTLAYIAGRRRRDPRTFVAILLLGQLVLGCWLVAPQAGSVQTAFALLPIVACFGLLLSGPRLRIVGVFFALSLFLTFIVLVQASLLKVSESDASPIFQLGAIGSLQLLVATMGGAVVNRLARAYSLFRLQSTHEQLVSTTVRHQQVLDVTRIGLWDWTPSAARRLTVSPSFTTITGYTDDDLASMGHDLQSLVHPEDLPGLRDAWSASALRQDRLRIDFRLKTRTRGYRWFALRAQVSGPDALAGPLSGSLQDMQFFKAVEDALRTGRDKALEADRVKADFIAVMSHEVRTPLNAILGSIALLQRGRHDDQTRELLDLADEAGAGLLRVVKDLLDMSRIEAGKMEIEMSTGDILALVTRTLDAWRPQAGSRGLYLRLETPDRAPPPLRVDFARIRQILGNLISNAIKHTQSGGVTVSLRVTPSSAEFSDVEIHVKDTGGGISPALAPSLFLAFEGARDHSGGGAGLGLYISRNLARLMGGSLVLEETSASGSHFCFRLRADLAITPRVPAAEAEDEPEWTGARILAVDDNEANRRIASLVIAQFGARPTVSPSGEDALQRCANEAFDVILLDIVMPGLDGFATLARLRAEEGPNRKTPVVALTARLSPEDVERYHAAGFDDVAAKPINIPELARALAPFLKTRVPRGT